MRLVPQTRPCTLSRAILNSLVLGLLLFAPAALVMTHGDQPEEVGYIRPLQSPDPVAQLIRTHGCWPDVAPSVMAGKFPTHAIVGGRYVGKRLADLAFDQEVGGNAHGLVVSAFCR